MECAERLRGRNAVVTGSSRGIGRAVAMALSAEGARVVVNGRSLQPVNLVVEQIRDAGGTAIAAVGSVADFEFARELVDRCVDAFGTIDLLVNCAGVAEPEGSSILDLSAEAWRNLIDAHLTGTFNCCRHAAPRMVAQRSGAIINTSSHAFLGSYGGTGYPASKGGINSLTFAIAAELREHGVRANAVCPGAKTRLSTGPAYERHIEDLHARGLLGDYERERGLSPADPKYVAPLYLFLASDLAKEISGRIFSASGSYVGLFARGSEAPLAHRDWETAGAWDLEELAETLLQSKEL